VISPKKNIFEITLDEEFLYNENTVYPVIVDPTLTLDTAAEFSDAYVSSAYPT